jgi:DNA polymerase-3 subunit gamma/tau
MLSGHSFNALLKTLEEPPPHVKFLFATTDPQKLPVTILSRCLQFNLKRMPLDQIGGHLKFILEQESVEFDEKAIRQLAQAADGSMRDALSLMDQAISFGGGELKESEVKDMLGTISHDWLFALIQAVAAGDGKSMLQTVEDMSSQVPEFEAAADGLISLLHQTAILQGVPDIEQEDEHVRQLAESLSKEDVQLFYQIALNGRRDLPLSPDPRAGFEMLLLRMMTFRPVDVASLPAQPATDATNDETVDRKKKL